MKPEDSACGMNVSGITKRSVALRPAAKGFDADDFPVGDFHHRLIKEFKLAVTQRVRQDAGAWGPGGSSRQGLTWPLRAHPAYGINKNLLKRRFGRLPRPSP